MISMSDVVVFSNEVLTVFMIFGILGLISIFLVKLLNILDKADLYDSKISVITLAIGIISYVFIEIGVLVTVGQNVEATLIEYNIYNWFARVFIILIWIFWFAELFLYAAKSMIEPLKRMAKRRDERVNRY